MSRRRFLRASAVLVAACGVLAGPAFAQDYPAKPIRVIVPFPPGGGVDIVGRAWAEKLAQRLGQPTVVDNRPGAGTTIGTEAAAKSPPDGYTVLVGPISSQAIVAATYPKLGFDFQRDFAPVSRIGYGTIGLVVPAASPAKTAQQLVAMARAQPNRLAFASSGQGALIHLTTEMFMQAAQIRMTHVPYKGSTQIVPDLLNGNVDLALDSLPAYLPHVRAGKARVLAVASRTRSPIVPDVPTMAEVGLPDVVSATDYAVYAPSATPRGVIAVLHRETEAILGLADFRARLASLGIDISGSTPEQLGAEVADEMVKWARVVKAAGIRND